VDRFESPDDHHTDRDDSDRDHQEAIGEEGHDDLAQINAKRRASIERRARYVTAGKEAIMGMLAEHRAVLWGEIIARAADYGWRDTGTVGRFAHIDPHHLRTALLELLSTSAVLETTAATRGGRNVSVYHREFVAGTKREVEKAIARKRLLGARYLGWASGSDSTPGVIGAAAEDVVHASLREAAPDVGYRLVNPKHGTVVSMGTGQLPGGPLDNGAFFFDESGNRHFIAIEVKSLRQWVYPSTRKLYQLLYKSSLLAQELPETRVLPVLIARKAHITTYRMARDLGFHVIDTLGIQWLPRLASIEERTVAEVRNELGYADLRFATGANAYITKQFTEVIPSIATARSARWAAVGARLVDWYAAIWTDNLLPDEEPLDGSYINNVRDVARREIAQLPPNLRTEHRSGGW
jgi:hypothetical protein